MTDAQRQAVEDYVNAAIATDAEMVAIEMTKQQARKDASGMWSKELCGGPHIQRTGDLKAFGTFSIQKEESVSAGVRRVKIVLS